MLYSESFQILCFKMLQKFFALFVVNRFYLKPYDQNQDFYIQFYERLKEGKDLLALA